jgi:hypothetical protein
VELDAEDGELAMAKVSLRGSLDPVADPGGIPSAIKKGVYLNLVRVNVVVDCKWKALRENPV